MLRISNGYRMNQARRITAALCAITGLLIAIASISSVITRLPKFLDPCVEWGVERASGRLPASGPCRDHIEGTSQTKSGAVMQLLLVHGGILAASVLGIIGTLRPAPVLSALAAFFFLLEAIPLVFSFAPLAVLASALFLLEARLSVPHTRGVRVLRYLTGPLAGCGVLPDIAVSITRAEIPPVLLLVRIAALLLVVAAAWWPEPHAPNIQRAALPF
jgi:hypothetical protein